MEKSKLRLVPTETEFGQHARENLGVVSEHTPDFDSPYSAGVQVLGEFGPEVMVVASVNKPAGETLVSKRGSRSTVAEVSADALRNALGHKHPEVAGFDVSRPTFSQNAEGNHVASVRFRTDTHEWYGNSAVLTNPSHAVATAVARGFEFGSARLGKKS